MKTYKRGKNPFYKKNYHSKTAHILPDISQPANSCIINS